MECPNCGGLLTATKSGGLYRDNITGLLVRINYLRCKGCGNTGKDVVTHDITMFCNAKVPSAKT